MESVNLQKQTLAAGLILLLLALPASAQEANVAPPDKPKQADAVEKKAQSQSNHPSAEAHATQDGIKVHGQWMIVIRNPDGSIASRQEFENSLQMGDQVLAGVLGHTMTVGPWSILIRDPCVGHGAGGGQQGGCHIHEANAPGFPASESFAGLTVKLSGTPTLNALILSGSAKSTYGGTIFRVETIQSTCPATTLPADCGTTAHNFIFTQQDISPITIQPGQSIDVTVQLSFS